MPLIAAVRRQRQADLCEFEANSIYRATSRTGSKATEKPGLEDRDRERQRQRDKQRDRQTQRERS